MYHDVVDRQPLRLNLGEDEIEAWTRLMEDPPLSFTSTHCAQAREMLGWCVETLALRSGVSAEAIERIESGAELRHVTKQALAFAMEAEGVVFFPATKGD